MAKKTNEAQHQARVNKVFELLVNCWSRYDILQYASKNTDWNVDDRSIDSYIAIAKKQIMDNSKETQSEFIAKAKSQFRDLYKKSMSQKDIAECRRIVDTANKVLGYEKLNLDVTGEATIKVELPKE